MVEVGSGHPQTSSSALETCPLHPQKQKSVAARTYRAGLRAALIKPEMSRRCATNCACSELFLFFVAQMQKPAGPPGVTQTKRPLPGHFQSPQQKRWLGANTTDFAMEPFRAPGTPRPCSLDPNSRSARNSLPTARANHSPNLNWN